MDDSSILKPPVPEAADPGPRPQSAEAAETSSKATAREAAEVEISRRSRRSFLWAAAAAALGYSGWRWLTTRRPDDEIPWPLRRVLELNEGLARDYFRPTRLSPTFSVSAAGEPRANGEEGLGDDFDAALWKLRVAGLNAMPNAAARDMDLNGEEPALLLSMREIKQLPRVEMVTELKCVEGWSQVVHWAGARFLDFAARYGPRTRSGEPPDIHGKPQDLVPYVSLETPDGGYFVGLDMDSALHPQTLLCYEMNGAPLTPEHGAPLRLVIPVKYGIKNIKRIGTIRFTDRRPADYWAERGYDWYAGH